MSPVRPQLQHGGGRTEREHGLRWRVGLFIRWSCPDCVERFVIECNVQRSSLVETLKMGLPLRVDYMNPCAVDVCDLVGIYRSAKPWAGRVYRGTEEFDGTPIEVRGM